MFEYDRCSKTEASDVFWPLAMLLLHTTLRPMHIYIIACLPKHCANIYFYQFSNASKHAEVKFESADFFFYCMAYRNELKLIVCMAVHSQQNVVVVIQYPFEFLMFVFVSESYVSIRLCLWKSRQHPWQIGSRECLCLVTIIHRLKLPKIVRAS